MNFIYFGTPEFSKIVLEKMIAGEFIPVAIVTNPDRPTGRKKIITASPVKKLVANGEWQINVLQPEKLDDDFANELRGVGADLAVLAAYGKIIPKEIIDIFPKGIIVVHPSLLPKYRGATPIQTTILGDETETGTTLIIMDEKVDHGKIISNSKLLISNNDNYEMLSKKLAELSGDLLVKTLPKYLNGEIKPVKQNHSQATYTKKFTAEDGFVDLEKDEPKVIWRKVRALNPEPGIYTIKNNRRMKILEADLVDGKLVLKKIQFEGGRPKEINI